MPISDETWLALVRGLAKLATDPAVEDVKLPLNRARADRAQQTAHVYAKRMGLKITTRVRQGTLHIFRLTSTWNPNNATF